MPVPVLDPLALPLLPERDPLALPDDEAGLLVPVPEAGEVAVVVPLLRADDPVVVAVPVVDSVLVEGSAVVSVVVSVAVPDSVPVVETSAMKSDVASAKSEIRGAETSTTWRKGKTYPWWTIPDPERGRRCSTEGERG